MRSRDSKAASGSRIGWGSKNNNAKFRAHTASLNTVLAGHHSEGVVNNFL